MIDEAVEFLRDKQNEKGITTVQLLKSFPRKKRVEIVDILRGAKPIPLDWKELSLMAQILDISKEEIYPFWENRVKQLFQSAGMNLQANGALMTAMFECARDYIEK